MIKSLQNPPNPHLQTYAFKNFQKQKLPLSLNTQTLKIAPKRSKPATTNSR